jgi:transposase
MSRRADPGKYGLDARCGGWGSVAALGNWVAAARRQRDGDGGPLSEDERAELLRLRKENAELRMQRDVLKRSVALWVNEAMGR